MRADIKLRLRWASLQSRKRAARYRSRARQMRTRRWVTAADATEIIGCAKKSLWNWEQRGQLDGRKMAVGGMRQKVFRLRDVRAIARSVDLRGA